MLKAELKMYQRRPLYGSISQPMLRVLLESESMKRSAII